jgi:hypothetical protein
MPRLFSSLLILASALAAHAGISQIDFTGIGHIYVLESDDWINATPKQKVGCLDDNGRFVSESPHSCGTFERLNDYPYTLSTKRGNCTFDDATQERNTDSTYGAMDYAWHCQNDHKTELWDELYTIVSSPPRYPVQRTLLTHPRTAFPTSSSASGTSAATTMPKRRLQKASPSRFGNTAGARSKWALHQATSNCS